MADEHSREVVLYVHEDENPQRELYLWVEMNRYRLRLSGGAKRTFILRGVGRLEVRVASIEPDERLPVLKVTIMVTAPEDYKLSVAASPVEL